MDDGQVHRHKLPAREIFYGGGGVGDQGPKGDQGPQGEPGEDGIVAVVATDSSPGRSLDETFLPNADRPTLCIYTVQIVTTVTAMGGSQAASVEFRSDASDPPTTVRCEAGTSTDMTGTLTLSLTQTDTRVLSYLVPAGHRVHLATSGAGTVSLLHQTEVTY